MKKHIISFIIALATAVTTWGTTLDQQADSAYSADKFQDAVELYNQAINEYGSSSKLYYNLGNAYYRCGNLGQAVLNYERALRLDPTDNNTRANLEFVNSKLIDKPGERGTFLENAFDSMATSMTSNGWAWLAFILFVLFAASVVLYLFSSAVNLRKLGFFGGGVLFVLSVMAIIVAIRAKSIATSTDYAIITSPSTILSTTPRAPKNRNEEAMLLHAGTKLHILDSITSRTDRLNMTWYDVEVDNEHRAWISSADVEKVN